MIKGAVPEQPLNLYKAKYIKNLLSLRLPETKDQNYGQDEHFHNCSDASFDTEGIVIKDAPFSGFQLKEGAF